MTTCIEFNRGELAWLIIALKTELADRRGWRGEKIEWGLDHDQDDRDIAVLEGLFDKIINATKRRT